MRLLLTWNDPYSLQGMGRQWGTCECSFCRVSPVTVYLVSLASAFCHHSRLQFVILRSVFVYSPSHAYFLSQWHGSVLSHFQLTQRRISEYWSAPISLSFYFPVCQLHSHSQVGWSDGSEYSQTVYIDSSPGWLILNFHKQSTDLWISYISGMCCKFIV